MKNPFLPSRKTLIIIAGIIVAWLSAMSLWAQSAQTIRGRILDEVSQTPLIGVNVIVADLKNSPGGTTDVNGDFRIERIPVGRHTIRITYIGYEEQTIPNVVVTAGKEVILNVAMIESVSHLSEVVVTSSSREDKTATNNDLAVVSARSFNIDDTKRYAGALGDPSRMAANFAGVIGGNDSRNDIVVRGNSPAGMLWQLEGLNIPNPNHFGALVATGGPVSILNNNNLDKSDFMTSAFPAQYGNATAGVFDLKLRDGNNQKREFMGQVGFNGFEVGAEGYFSKNSEASYIVNYRYSTLGVFTALGIDFGTGSNVPLYQDLNFKIALPVKNGKWSIFGIGGSSSIDLLGSEADLSEGSNLYGSENNDAYPRYRTGIAGISYETNLSQKTFARITLGASATHESFTNDSLVRDANQNVVARYLDAEGRMGTQKYSLSFLTRTKFNARNSLTSGVIIDALAFDLFNRDVYANIGTDTTRLAVNDNAVLSQIYTTWRHRFNNHLSLNAGLHAQHYSLNSQVAVEPRLSAQYVFNAAHSLSAGYGLHSQAQNITTSYVQSKDADGTTRLSNTQLDFNKSHHYVLTYDWNINKALRLKAEAYYQRLSNIPVEQRPTSFSAINTGASFGPMDEDSLVNKGTGRNYGMELTLERFFSRGYYFLVTTSLFNSRYKGSDGIERNTAFNTQYVFNVLAGKEWQLSKNGRFIAVSAKISTIGGRYLTPIDPILSQQYGRAIYVEREAFSEKQQAYFRTDIKLSYRKEYAKSTLEVSLDLQNVTNQQNIFSQDYNARTNQVITQYQQSFFPVPFVRYTF